MKSYKFILPVVVIFIAMILIKLFSPIPTNWNPSFSKNDKIPFGSYILFDQLPKLFPQKNIEVSSLPLYNTFNHKTVRGKNLIIISNTFDPDELDFKILQKLLKDGNDVFIAARSFGKIFQDSVKLTTNYSFFN